MNAIILAAGLGSRLKELTKNKHKALFEIEGVPNIERTINFLHEINIKEIYIITGYLSEQFEYLKDKFNVELIKNNNYDKLNNLSSFSLALPYFADSFIIDADVALLKNVLHIPTTSTYFTTIRKKTDKKEWVIKKHNNRVIGVEICNKVESSLLGISFFVKKDAEIIKKHIESLGEESFLDPKKYYDNAILDTLYNINMGFIDINNNLVAEIDDMDDLNELNFKIKALKLDKFQ